MLRLMPSSVSRLGEGVASTAPDSTRLREQVHAQLEALLSFVRQSWGGSAGAVSALDVAKLR